VNFYYSFYLFYLFKLQKTKFHRSQTLGYKNGYKIPTISNINALSEEELDALANHKPTLTYGQAAQAPPEDFIPGHVAFDKKVLLFFAYFKQTVHESPNEYYCVRPVRIFYYLEDDSIAVVEPIVENRFVIENTKLLVVGGFNFHSSLGLLYIMPLL